MSNYDSEKITIPATLIFDERGKITNQRILDVSSPKIEASITAIGVVNAMTITDMTKLSNLKTANIGLEISKWYDNLEF